MMRTIDREHNWFWQQGYRDPVYDWSLHCGKCQASRLAYLYAWRNMIYGNRYVGLTGIEIWDGRR